MQTLVEQAVTSRSHRDLGALRAVGDVFHQAAVMIDLWRRVSSEESLLHCVKVVDSIAEQTF